MTARPEGIDGPAALQEWLGVCIDAVLETYDELFAHALATAIPSLSGAADELEFYGGQS